MAKRSFLVLVAAGGLAMAAAVPGCAEASGEIAGGRLSPAGETAVVPRPFESDCDPKGTHWADLYCSLFGPTGQAPSCSLQPGGCHGQGGLGAASGSGIECYSQSECFRSFRDKGLVRDADAQDPTRSPLIGILRKQNGRGLMPKSPADYRFSEADINRIQTWIAAGAPND